MLNQSFFTDPRKAELDQFCHGIFLMEERARELAKTVAGYEDVRRALFRARIELAQSVEGPLRQEHTVPSTEPRRP